MNEINFNIEDIKNINFDLGVAVKEIAPPLENLEVTPTKEQQVFNHENSYGYDTVTVEPYKANVDTKTITKNGTYNASDDNLDGYSSVEVATSGVDINEYFGDTLQTGNSSTSSINMIIKKIPTPTTLPIDCSYLFAKCESIEEIPQLDTSQVTNMTNMFLSCKSITTIPSIDTSNCTNMNGMFRSCESLQETPLLDTSQVTNMNNMFNDCKKLESIPLLDTSNCTTMNGMFMGTLKLKTIPQINTSKVTDMSFMFYGNGTLEEIPSLDTNLATGMSNMFGYQSKLTTVGLLDCSSVLNISSMFNSCSGLINLDGLKDLGKAYLTTRAENYSNYTLSLNSSTKLTHDSLMNVINNLYDIKTAGCKNQLLQLGSTNKAKLTEEEIAIATNKGWNVR